jgi:hypothetical protein
MKEKHDQRASDIEFKRGQHVLLKQDHIAPGKKKKLEAKWTGPYYIVSKLNHDTYVIRNCETHKEHSSPVNISRLKLYNDPRDTRPPPDAIPEGFSIPVMKQRTHSHHKRIHINTYTRMIRHTMRKLHKIYKTIIQMGSHRTVKQCNRSYIHYTPIY